MTEKVACDECDGKGEVRRAGAFEDAPTPDDEDTFLVICPVCNGEGVVSDEK